MADWILTERSNIVAVADSIREKTGQTGKLTLGEMVDDVTNEIVGGENLDVVLQAQDNLIDQIQTALAGKASITLPNLSNPGSAENLEQGYELIDGDGNIVVGTHVCSGDSGSTGATFSVVNNLNHLLYVNGRQCPIGETTSGIPYAESLNSFLIWFDGEDDFISNWESYIIIHSADEYGVPGFISSNFYAHSEFIYDFGVESDSCHPSSTILSTFGLEQNNICGYLLSPPWDYTTDAPADGATIEFGMG